MDELDQRIVGILQSDGRISNAGIARSVGVSEGTIRRRLRHLVEDDVVKVIAIPNLEKMGYSTSALIGLQAGPGSVDSVVDTLSSMKETQYVAVTTGSYDIFFWVGLTSTDALGQFLRNTVGKIPGVIRTETFVNLEVRKGPVF